MHNSPNIAIKDVNANHQLGIMSYMSKVFDNVVLQNEVLIFTFSHDLFFVISILYVVS